MKFAAAYNCASLIGLQAGRAIRSICPRGVRLRIGSIKVSQNALVTRITSSSSSISISQDLPCTLLCHGYVSATGRDFALMLAYGGALPPAHSVAVGSEQGRKHRFGWQECMKLERVPKIVFSAACSSGLGHIAGIGERVGLFSSLQ